MRIALSVLLSSYVAVLLACDRPAPTQDRSPAKCATVGQQCEFAPGKLGACVMPTGCTDNSCLICQSQH